MIDQNDIQKLIDLPIEGVAKRLGLIVKRHFSLSVPSTTTNVRRYISIHPRTATAAMCVEHMAEPSILWPTISI